MTTGRRSSFLRTVFAIVLAPLLGLAVGTVLLDAIGASMRADGAAFNLPAALRAVPFIAWWGSALAYPATLLILLPAHLLLVRANRVGWGWYVLAGLALVIVGTAIWGAGSGKYGAAAFVWFIYAMPAALIFRAIAVRRAPVQSLEPTSI